MGDYVNNQRFTTNRQVGDSLYLGQLFSSYIK